MAFESAALDAFLPPLPATRADPQQPASDIQLLADVVDLETAPRR